MLKSYDREEVERIRGMILSEVCSQCDDMSTVDLRSVLRYLKHGELQFGFEHFMVVVIEGKLVLTRLCRAEVLEIAEFVGTDYDSVIKAGLYDQILQYVDNAESFLT